MKIWTWVSESGIIFAEKVKNKRGPNEYFEDHGCKSDKI